METISIGTLKSVFVVIGMVLLVLSLVGAYKKKQAESAENAFGDRFAGILLGAFLAFMMAPVMNWVLDGTTAQIHKILKGAESVVSIPETPVRPTKPADLKGVSLSDGDTKLVLRSLATSEEWVLTYTRLDGTTFHDYVVGPVFNAGEQMKDVKVNIERDGVLCTAKTLVPSSL